VANRRFGRQGGFARGDRRRTGWSLGPSGDFTRSVIGSTLFPVTSTSVLDGITLVRMRGWVDVRVTSVAAATDFMTGAVGIAKFSQNAAAAGISSLEVPVDDMDWDGWIWHSFFKVGGLANNGFGFQRLEVDSKAMRKFGEGDAIVGVLQVDEENGTVVLDAGMHTRVLDLVP